MPERTPTRRSFLAASAALFAGCHLVPTAGAPEPTTRNAEPATQTTEPIIDIHQHTNYSGRTDEQLLAHQRNMGISKTILLPAGRYVDRPSTHMGKSNGLAVGAGTNEACYRLTQDHPGEYYFFANDTPDLDGARAEIEKYLKLGALGIGEQKFNIDVESPAFAVIADVARDYDVPVLCHFQVGMYNHGFRRLWRVMDKYPTVKFIAHAQTTWTNVDADYADDPKNLYPKTPYKPGGVTDRYLRDYEHFYADISAGSGLNSLHRDPEHARAFLLMHQDKIFYGSDCNDHPGKPPICQGALTIAAIKWLAPSKGIARKILHDNAVRVLRVPA
ncbi:MAG TPA: amidohydrolase family protein [Tepidisphaeraceae bacterium]|jgi:predicted TIM-barrel fold metal-dependent hydrolase